MDISVTLAPTEMSAYKRSLNHTLSTRPVSDSPNLAPYFPTATNLLHLIDLYVETLDDYHPFKQARRDVIQYQRSHSDIEGFKLILGVTDDWIDTLFLDSMKFEGTL